MNINVKKILFGEKQAKKPPVLLAVTPPRTGERTLLGVENLLQSIAVPEPFSLELAGDAGGVNLLARCQDDQVVRSQIAAHYPQARIRQVPVDDDPIFVHAGEQAWGLTLRSGRAGVRAPAHLPGRRPAGPRLRPPAGRHRLPVRPAPGGTGPGPPAAALPGSRLVPGPPAEGFQEPRPAAARPVLHLPDQAPAAGRRHHGRPGRRSAGRPQGLPLGAGRGVSQGVAPGFGRRHRPHRGGLGLVALEAVPQPGLRPAADQGEGGPHRLRRRAPGHRRAARQRRGTAGQGNPGAGGRRLPPLRPPRRGQVQR